MTNLLKEYKDFMNWFSENYPDLFNKYSGNIGVAFKEGGGVSVNNNNRISNEEFDMLTEIANKYYQP